MSWNNVIPAELLVSDSMIKSNPIENPLVTIPLSLLLDCLIQYSIEGAYGMTGSADHPAFAELRRVLAARHFIEIPEYTCWNGDRVIKRFQFNGIQLEIGDKFYCAAAWQSYKKDMK